MAEVEALADRTGIPVQEAAAKVKISDRTVRAHRAKRRAGKAPAAKSSFGTTPSPPPSPASSPAGNQAPALPQGGAVSGRPDLLELVREILDARHPAARAELDQGLVVHARGDAGAFEAWKVRPPEVAEVVGDELDALGAVLADLRALLAKAGPDAGPRIAIVKALDGVSKSLSVVRLRRPHIESPDQVQEQVRGAMDTCVEWLLLPVREAAAKLKRDRARLFDGLTEDVAPRHLATIGARVDAMLGGAPS